MTSVAVTNEDHFFLHGGGMIGECLRNADWSKHPLGDPGAWPSLLKTFTGVIFSASAPACIFWGEQFFQIFNDGFAALLPSTDLTSLAAGKASETWNRQWTTLEYMLKQIQSNEPISEHDVLTSFPFAHAGKEIHFHFSTAAIKDEKGKIQGILVTCIPIEQKFQMLQHELSETQVNLHNLLNIVTDSDFKFRRLVKEAPVAIALLHGPELVIEEANDAILKIWKKKRSIIGNRLADALPEFSGQSFFDLFSEVFITGTTYYGNENKTYTENNGELEEGYIDFIYQPVKSESGIITRIMIVVTDVTQQVKNRIELERAYERARLAKEAAQLGTFDLDVTNNILDWDERCRMLFGIFHQDIVTYENDFVRNLHPDDTARVLTVIADSFNQSVSNGNYDIEYRTVGASDQRLRWVRAKGRVYFNSQGEPIRFIGSVLDITEQKQDELRKNDFIGMVSHELKTPLTSINTIVQLLTAKANQTGDTSDLPMLQIAGRQVAKMVNQINGFLNISRLESGKLNVKKIHFPLNELLQETIDDVNALNQNQAIGLELADSGLVFADRDKLGAVITNLLSNAVKYSPPGYPISVRYKISGSEAEVHIKDQGMGISQIDVDHVFERYYRVENSSTHHISGFGIGLYLCAEIIKQHNGKIWVESNLREGSTFSFIIPVNV